MSIATQLTTPLTTPLTTSLTGFSPIDFGVGAWYSTLDSSTLDPTNLTWKDKSGNGRNAVSPDANRYPAITQNAINGRPAFFFDGNNATTALRDMLAFDGTFLANTNYTVVQVDMRTVSGLLKYVISGNQQVTVPIPTLDNRILSLGFKTGTQRHFAQSSNNYITTVPAFTTATPENWINRYSSTIGKNAYKNGVLQTLTADGSPVPTQGLLSYNDAQIGRNLSANYYTGYIGEIQIYPRYLSDAEMAIVQADINQRWGF